jgi:hypothetical protein
MVKLTWKNILLVIILFYVIGDLFVGIKILINKEIKEYQDKNYLEYQESIKKYDDFDSVEEMYNPSFLKNDTLK